MNNLFGTKFDYKLNYSTTTPTNKINMTIYFKNLTIKLSVLYIINTHENF